MLKPPPCCASPEFAGPVTDGAVSTERAGAGVGVTAGAGLVRLTLAAADVSARAALDDSLRSGLVAGEGRGVGVATGVAVGMATLPVAASLLLPLRRPPAVRGRSASPPPRTARPGVLVFVLLRAISTGVGRGVGAGRAGVGVGRGCVVVLATVSAGADCARGVGVTTGAGGRVPASLFAV